MKNELNKNIDYEHGYKHGHKQGYLQAIKNTEKLLMAVDNARTICPFTGDVLINFSEILRERNRLR